MSVRMLSRPSSSGPAQAVQQSAGSSGAVPTSPPFLPKSPSIFASPSRSPGSGAAPSPSTRLASSPVFDAGIFGADSVGQQIPAIDVEYPGASASKIVLPPPYEGEDLTDPLSKQVVVIGVISRLEDKASQLLDRILLAQVFSGKKCANPRERRNLQGDQETVSTTNPNFPVTSGCDDVVVSSLNLLRNENDRVLPQENGIVRGRSHGKGRGKYEESSRSRDGSQRDQNSGSRAGDNLSHTPLKTKGSIENKFAGNGRERDWIDGKIKNHYDREKGVLYVQYVWGSSPHDRLKEENRAGENLAEALERHEADSLRGLLFMFSVRFSL